MRKLKKGLLLILIFPFYLFSQTSIDMEKINNIYMIPCKVNGLKLKFILDTGASDVSISQTEAQFMLKNGYLNKEDIGEKEYYTLANGNIAEGVIINLREIEIGGIILKNIKASIILEQKAPLLLGQTALQKLGAYKIIENKLILEDYLATKEKSNIIDEKNGFKTLKLGTPLDNLPSFFKTSECSINKNTNVATCNIKDAPIELKTVFDIKMDLLIANLDLNAKTMIGIQLIKRYRTVVQSENPTFLIMKDYKDLIVMYSKALGIKPDFFSTDELNSMNIASTEGGYAYWKGSDVILTVGTVIKDIKLTEDYKPEYFFELKINYMKNEGETTDSILKKF